MKTYAEVITHEAGKVFNDYLNGSNTYRTTSAEVIGYIYNVEERDVDIDIDEEFMKMVDSRAR